MGSKHTYSAGHFELSVDGHAMVFTELDGLPAPLAPRGLPQPSRPWRP